MFMYMQYAGWMARMDGRRIERARARIEEGRERGVGGRGVSRRTTTNNNIYKATRHFTPIIISIIITLNINNHHFFQKPSNLIPPPQNQPPKMQFFALLTTAALAAAAPSVLETRGGEKVCASGAPYCCQLDVLGVAAVSCSDGKFLFPYQVVKSNELSTLTIFFFFFFFKISPRKPQVRRRIQQGVQAHGIECSML